MLGTFRVLRVLGGGGLRRFGALYAISRVAAFWVVGREPGVVGVGGTIEDDIDDIAHIGDVDKTIVIGVGTRKIEVWGFLPENLDDDYRHVGDIDMPVVVGIATQYL